MQSHVCLLCSQLERIQVDLKKCLFRMNDIFNPLSNFIMLSSELERRRTFFFPSGIVAWDAFESIEMSLWLWYKWI